jgi:hypothetical protein
VRRRWVAVVVSAVAVVVVGLVVVDKVVTDHNRETANGTGLTYEGRFYWASGVRVKDSALGMPVAGAVPFQDTTADLREIVGHDPQTTLAALLPSLDGSPGGLRWTFVSTDQDRGSNPAGYDDVRDVLVTSS